MQHSSEKPETPAGSTPVESAFALPAPAGTPLPVPFGPPAALRAPEPHLPAETSHPSVIGKLVEPEPDEDPLVALASLAPEALAPPSFLEPIGLPEAARLSVLALFQDRAAIWQRIDALGNENLAFQQAIQRAFGPGVTPTLTPLTDGGDPEDEVAAIRDAVAADQERMRELTAAVSVKKIELQRLRERGAHPLRWAAGITVVLGGIGAAVATLL